MHCRTSPDDTRKALPASVGESETEIPAAAETRAERLDSGNEEEEAIMHVLAPLA